MKNSTIHGLRGLAALMVFIYHVYGMLYTKGVIPEFDHDGLFRLYYGLGPIGVELFFVISGILITQTLIRHDNIKHFLLGRVYRIYPVFLVIHLVVFLVGPIINYEWMGDNTISEYITNFFLNLFMLPGVFNLPIAQKNAWSLSYEFLFYTLSVFAFVSIKRLKYIVIRVICFIVITGVSLVFLYTHKYAIFFVVGVVLYFLKEKLNKELFPSWMNYTGLVFLSFVFWFHGTNYLLEITSMFLLFVGIIYEKGALSKALNFKGFQSLGTISYSFYLWHPFVLFPLREIVSRMNIGATGSYLLFGSVGFMLTIITSYASYRLIETKFMKNSPRIVTKPISNKGLVQ